MGTKENLKHLFSRYFLRDKSQSRLIHKMWIMLITFESLLNESFETL